MEECDPDTDCTYYVQYGQDGTPLHSTWRAPGGSVRRRLLQTLIGLLGLAGIGSLKKSVGRRGDWSDQSKGSLKALTYAALSAWTFGLSQLAAKVILG